MRKSQPDKASLVPTAATRCLWLIALGACALAGGCASANSVDPFEKSNRFMYNVNDGFDAVVLKPLSVVYVAVFPKPIRDGLGNAFNNLRYGNVIANDFLQGKMQQGLGDLGRMAANSTIGIGGLLDVATPMHLPAHDNDFGTTLALWGVGQGDYLVLPIVGSSTVRDAPGLAVDYATYPLAWVNVPLAAAIPLDVTETADARARGDVLMRFRNEAALDPYVFTRTAYLQYRENLIHPGKPAPADQDLYNIDDTPPATQPATGPSK